MIDYFEQRGGKSYLHGKRTIPDNPNNRDFQRMNQEVADGEAQISPYEGSNNELGDAKSAKKTEIADYFIMLALEDNLIVTIQQMTVIKLVYDSIPVPDPNPKCDRLFSNADIAVIGYQQVNQADTVAEVEAIDVPGAPWHRKP